MTRGEKKCLAFSLGMHSLLAIILIGSAAFETMPKHTDMQILNMIPSRILDQSGVGSGNPQAAQTPPPQMQQVTPQPPPPQPQQVQPTPPTPQPVVQAKTPPPEPIKQEQPRVEPKPVEREVADTHTALPTPKPPKKQHEIKPDFTPYNAATPTRQRTKPKPEDNTEANAAAAQAAAAQARRDRAVRQALNSLASGLEVKASQHSIVDVHGDGGQSYAGYNEVLRTIYYNAWAAPDNVANKFAEAKVKLVVARDGSVISAEIISGSGESSYDKTVKRALDTVTHVPPFPSESQDQQRTFFLSFTPKDATG